MTSVAVFGTVAAATVAWAASEVVSGRRRRVLWTLAAVLMLVHSIAAFATIYGWSHQTAVEATARQTRAVTGFASGSGIYVNYAFLLLWLGDAIWWWLTPEQYETRARWISWFIRGFVWFMFLNGAVIFADGWMRAIGAAAVLAVRVSWVRHR